MSVANDLVRTHVTPKPAVMTASALPQTVVLESPAVGSDAVLRTVATVNSVSPSVVVGPSTGLGGSVSVLGDAHVPVVNSRVDGHKADSMSVLPMGEVVSGVSSVSGASSSSSSVVEFSASASSPIGEHDVSVITVGDAGQGLFVLYSPPPIYYVLMMISLDVDAILDATESVNTEAHCL